MKIKFMLRESPYLCVQSVSVLGSFNGYDKEAGAMNKVPEGWVTEVELLPGEHYYKFLINEQFMLNDPQNNVLLKHLNDELWSVIVINEQNERLFSNKMYPLKIESYAVTSVQTELPVAINKKTFYLGMDTKLVTRFSFTNIKGLYCISALWFDAQGQFFDYSENILFEDEFSSEQPVYLWFWLPLQEPDKVYPEGQWTLKLFVNGGYVLEDKYTLSHSTSYAPNGRIFSGAIDKFN